MDGFRPDKNASFGTERLFAFGAGLFIAASILSKGEPEKSAVVGICGVVLVVASAIASIVIKRRQLAKDRAENLKTVAK